MNISVQAPLSGCAECAKERSVPNEEGFLLFDRTIDEVEDRIHSRPPNLQSVVTMSAAGFGESAGHAFGETSALVGALPPFPALVAQIVFLAIIAMRKAAMLVYFEMIKSLGSNTRSLGVSQFKIMSICRIISRDLVLVRIQTGKQGGEGRAAHGSREFHPRRNRWPNESRRPVCRGAGSHMRMPHPKP